MPTRRYHGYHFISPDKRTTIVEQFLFYGWDVDFIASINDVDPRTVTKYVYRVALYNTVLARAELKRNKAGRPSRITLYATLSQHTQQVIPCIQPPVHVATHLGMI